MEEEGRKKATTAGNFSYNIKPGRKLISTKAGIAMHGESLKAQGYNDDDGELIRSRLRNRFLFAFFRREEEEAELKKVSVFVKALKALKECVC